MTLFMTMRDVKLRKNIFGDNIAIFDAYGHTVRRRLTDSEYERIIEMVKAEDWEGIDNFCQHIA